MINPVRGILNRVKHTTMAQAPYWASMGANRLGGEVADQVWDGVFGPIEQQLVDEFWEVLYPTEEAASIEP